MFTQAHRYPGLPFSSGQQCRRSGLGANGAPRAAYPTLGSLPHTFILMLNPPSSWMAPAFNYTLPSPWANLVQN